MTAIAAYVDDDHAVWMVGDSACVDPNSHGIFTMSSPKIFLEGSYAVGTSGNARLSDILRYSDVLPELPAQNWWDAESLRKFLVQEFIPELIDEVAASKMEPEDEDPLPGNILLGVRGYIFMVMSNYYVMHIPETFKAIGSASEVLTGAIAAQLMVNEQCGLTLPPNVILGNAMSTAVKYNFTVRDPMTLIRAGYDA